MSRLLHAGFVRLRKDTIFWAGMIIMALLEFFMIRNDWDVETINSAGKLNDILFCYMSGIGFICSVFCSFFSGRDYQDGTIRNKLIAGYTKGEIYISNLILNITMSFVLAFFFFVIEIILGVWLLGRTQVEIGALVFALLGNCFTVMAFCSFFTMIAMLIQNKSDIICIAMACALLFSAVYVEEKLLDIEGLEITYGTKEEIEKYGRTTQKEYDKFMSGLTGLPEGEYGDYSSYQEIHAKEQMILNKDIYQWFYEVLPYGQAIQYSSGDVKHPGRLCLYSIGWILVTTSFGVLVFRKKNIR